MRWSKMLVAGTIGLVAAAVAYVVRQRRAPSACPYGQSIVLEMPRLFLTRDRLRRLLDPRPGERVLEIGPGRGYYTLDVASRLLPGGTMDILDVQQEMLAATMRRARERGLANIVPAQGDARSLPYAAGTFDAAYLVATLGEVPDQDAALGELFRVVTPGGRLIVGEGLPDPHMVPFGQLRARAEAIGWHAERQEGGRFGYVARFRRP